MLLQTDPQLYQRDCEHCRLYMYAEKGEEKGKVTYFHGEPMRRPDGTGPPCTYKGGCRKGHYNDQRVLWPMNVKVVQHNKECQAVGSFPDDDMVRHNATVIYDVEKMLHKIETDTTNEMLKALALRGVV